MTTDDKWSSGVSRQCSKARAVQTVQKGKEKTVREGKASAEKEGEIRRRRQAVLVRLCSVCLFCLSRDPLYCTRLSTGSKMQTSWPELSHETVPPRC